MSSTEFVFINIAEYKVCLVNDIFSLQIATECVRPVVPEQASELVSPISYTYNEEIVYQCNSGHEYILEFGSITVFSTTCQANGSSIPDHSAAVCSSIVKILEDNFVNMC